jgi:hypothetical protein
VQSRSFEPGDLVLRLKQKSIKMLEPPWEGPYLIKEAIPGEAYRLLDIKAGIDETTTGTQRIYDAFTPRNFSFLIPFL